MLLAEFGIEILLVVILFFLIIINYIDYSYQYINELKDFTNSVIPLTKQSHLNSYNDKFIKHPCYLKDFIFITGKCQIPLKAPGI